MDLQLQPLHRRTQISQCKTKGLLGLVMLLLVNKIRLNLRRLRQISSLWIWLRIKTILYQLHPTTIQPSLKRMKRSNPRSLLVSTFRTIRMGLLVQQSHVLKHRSLNSKTVLYSSSTTQLGRNLKLHLKRCKKFLRQSKEQKEYVTQRFKLNFKKP